MFVSSFLIVFVVLFVAGVVGFAFHLLGGLMHLFLLVALISLAVHFARGHPETAPTVGVLPIVLLTGRSLG